MTLSVNGGAGSGAAGGAALQVHDQTLGGGATWHWSLDGSGVESLVGGAPLDITGTLLFDQTSPGGVEALDNRRSTGLVTGSIGAAVRIHTAITCAAWIKRTGALGGNLGLIGVRGAGSGEANNFPWDFSITSADNKVRAYWQNGNKLGNTLAATTATVDDTWEHWCMTRNAAGTITKLYKNGILDATSGTLNAPTGSTTQNIISIGVAASTFTGDMFSAIVFEEEMDAAGVLALYNSTATTGSWA